VGLLLGCRRRLSLAYLSLATQGTTPTPRWPDCCCPVLSRASRPHQPTLACCCCPVSRASKPQPTHVWPAVAFPVSHELSAHAQPTLHAVCPVSHEHLAHPTHVGLCAARLSRASQPTPPTFGPVLTAPFYHETSSPRTPRWPDVADRYLPSISPRPPTLALLLLPVSHEPSAHAPPVGLLLRPVSHEASSHAHHFGAVCPSSRALATPITCVLLLCEISECPLLSFLLL